MKNGFLENKGITLLALIITIVVLLILSVISISMIVGEDGVITRARMAEEEKKYAEVEEQRDLWLNNLKLGNYGSGNVQNLNGLIEEMQKNGVITGKDAKDILETGQLKYDLIGKETTFFEVR